MKIGTKALLLAALLLVGCQRPEDEGPLQLAGHVFIFNYRLSTAVYEVALNKVGAIPDGSMARTEYENPAGGPPLVTTTKIFPFWKKVALESPPLRCVVKDRPYSVKITLIGPDGRGLQHIETTITSTLDQSILAAKPLVVGPAYDKNPEVFKPDGTTDYAGDQGCKP